MKLTFFSYSIFIAVNNYIRCKILNEEIDEYIELLRKMNEEISIYNVDELYNNLEQINDLIKDDVQKELARSSDKVIYKFLQNENTNAREVLEKISNLHEKNK